MFKRIFNSAIEPTSSLRIKNHELSQEVLMQRLQALENDSSASCEFFYNPSAKSSKVDTTTSMEPNLQRR